MPMHCSITYDLPRQKKEHIHALHACEYNKIITLIASELADGELTKEVFEQILEDVGVDFWWGTIAKDVRDSG